ncbi:MAG: hypothetical protein ACREAA_05530 [Candidatus Polarisedimenticolia bacterium]
MQITKRENDGALNFEGVLWEVACESFPFSFPTLHFYSRLVGPPNAKFESMVVVEGPADYRHQGEKRPLVLSPDGTACVMSLYKGLPLPRPGLYHVQHYLDGRPSGKATLNVRQMQLAPAPKSSVQ